LYVGIDPGKDGALAWITDERDVLSFHVMPWRGTGRKAVLDATAIESILRLRADQTALVVVERPKTRPNESAHSAVHLGAQLGTLTACCESAGVSYLVVAPELWTRHICQGILPTSKTDRKARKQANVVRACELFPEFRDIAPGLNKAKESGVADALLIAEYARQWHQGSLIER
jgi:hypothetical protein